LSVEPKVEKGGHLRLHAFDRQNLQLHWQVDTQDGFLKSLATDGPHLYFLAYTDMVYGLDSQTGDEIWRYPTENWSPGFTLVGESCT